MTSEPAEGTIREAPLWELAAHDFAAWREGDSVGLERLVRRLTPVLWQIARAYGLDAATAEDVVQNAWLALVRNAGQVRDPQSVMRWTTRTTRREAWRMARATGREDPAEIAELDGAGENTVSAEEEALAQGSDATLWRHVRALPQRCRRLLRVVAFEDHPDYATLSADLGLATGSIGPIRRRCLEKLRTALSGDVEWSRR